METTVIIPTQQQVLLSVPQMDVSFIKTLARKMGWTFIKQPKASACHLDKAVASAHTSTLFETNDIDELMNALRK